MKKSGYNNRSRERLEDAGLLALKMKEGVMSQGVQRASRSWKRQGKRFLLEPPEAVQPSQDLDFDPAKPTLGL